MDSESTPSRPTGIAAALLERLEAATTRSHGIVTRSGEALQRLHKAADTANARHPRSSNTSENAVERTAAPDTRQMQRQHVLIVNHDPAFLDAVRVMLQHDDYNVTTTNLVPSTYEMIQAVGVDVLVVDVSIDEPQIMALIEQIVSGDETRELPLVFTSSDPEALDATGTFQGTSGRRFVFLKPFEVDALVDVVYALVGPA